MIKFDENKVLIMNQVFKMIEDIFAWHRWAAIARHSADEQAVSAFPACKIQN